MRKGLLLGGVMVMLLLLAAACAKSAATPTPTPVPPTATATPVPTAGPASIAAGGRLYDKWWKAATGAKEPTGDQALWATQTTNTRKGLDTWRCKECHGWDYKGKDGAYGSGSHKTGFTGVYDARAKSKEQIVAVLKGSPNSKHDFSSGMSDVQLQDLATFIREGLLDDSLYIDYATKKPKTANVDRGKQLYGQTCASCHGAEGKTLNFGSAEQPEYVGTIAKDNPWEFLHKVRFGQPGAAMPAGVEIGWSIQDVVDVLSHAQTLPDK